MREAQQRLIDDLIHAALKTKVELEHNDPVEAMEWLVSVGLKASELQMSLMTSVRMELR